MSEPALPPVLMLHAYPLSSAMWAQQAAALRGLGRQVMTPDLPGFGGRPGAVAGLDGAVRDLLPTLPAGPLDVVGLSMGGYLALELLAQQPGRVRRLVLADTSARADTDEQRQKRFEQAERALAEGTDFIVQAAAEEHPPGTFAQIQPMIRSASPEGVAAALRALAGRRDTREVLRAAQVPTLVLVGRQDTLTPPELAQELAELSGGQLEVIEGAQHLSNLDQPEAFTRALLDFLRE